MTIIEHIRENLARKLIKLARFVDPGNRFLFQADQYKVEFGWRQPKSKDDFVPNFIKQGSDINGDTGL